ncbi:KEOPS complex Pcc1-like subunit [Salinadaptatus halalkaliphilus]|uniref:KEOPS complex Pcc1-like subunit n=1 Tax=Salinadaptatus halalkaliphilus TaxID=2419781 RepID=A0A4S3TG55_9EURY|nr:KEOPS complex subunit Pcc1 [Salinadaptatus halalkaliphilus]THE62861.1 KEOPS complex Pcc1-like subunit [Salinadaptatus halalkaliphilus]
MSSHATTLEYCHESTLEFAYESDVRARIVADSVAREIGEIDDDRSRATIDREDSLVTVEIEATDAVALRAALNTWLTLVDVAQRSASAGNRILES